MCISDLVFMNDTTWITETKDSLEIILEIVNNFYGLNNIKVNKNKSELLVNVPEDKKVNKQTILLTFRSEQIQIKSKLYNELARILGIWINLNSNKQFVI